MQQNGYHAGETQTPTPTAAYPQPTNHENGNGNSKVVRFETNIPQTVAIRYSDGKLVEGRFGDQWLYSLMDGRSMYVPPIVANQICELDIKPREAFIVCKREVKTPGKKKASIHWFVERETPAPPPPSPPPPPPPPTPAAAGVYGVPPASPNPLGAIPPFVPADPQSFAANSLVKVPMNVAFCEVLDWMAAALRSRNEQWTDQARQDFVSTALISGQREGWIGMWERAVK